MTVTSSAASKIVSIEEINEAFSNLSSTMGGSKDNYFGLMYIAKHFGISPEKAAAFVSFGGNSYGIDAYYLDLPAKTLYLLAFRWSTDHMSLKDPLEKLGSEGMHKIFFNPMRSQDDSPMIVSLKTTLHQNWKSIDKVYVNFVFNGDPVDAEQSRVLSFLRESVEDKRSFVDSYLSRVNDTESLHELIFQYVSNEKSLGHVASSRESTQYDVEYDNSLTVSHHDNELRVVFVKLETLYRMYDDLGERFFEKNIRSGLDDGNMTNVQIKKSLKNLVDGIEPPEYFTLYHNGITLTAQNLQTLEGVIRMVEPRVLNGAQTIKILKQFVDESSSAANPEKIAQLHERLDQTKVMARVIKSHEDAFLKKVTINNNRQNPIMPWNLRANDLVQIGFEEMFNKLGIYYERRENAYKNLTDEDLEASGTEKGLVEIRKFAQTLLAMQGQIDRMSELKEIFENETWYADTFRDRYLQIDPRLHVLLYKIQFRLPSLIREIRSVGNEKYAYVGRAKNLLWCLAIQGILNDPKFDKYVEYYGNTTSPEAGITEILKNMATTKLRFILADTFENKKYQANIAEAKFTFLRTRATLGDCLDTAASRFNWERKYL
jgi:hypothetical protein